MTDSPFIQVMKYLEAGNSLYIEEGFSDEVVMKRHHDRLFFIDANKEDFAIDYWSEVGSVFNLGQYAKYLPSPPVPVSHVRRVEL